MQWLLFVFDIFNINDLLQFSFNIADENFDKVNDLEVFFSTVVLRIHRDQDKHSKIASGHFMRSNTKMQSQQGYLSLANAHYNSLENILY